MKIDKFGQYIYSQSDIIDISMSSYESESSKYPYLIDDISDDNISNTNNLLGNQTLIKYNDILNTEINDFDKNNQSEWFMPDEYKKLDIAKYVLDLCDNQAELQRCGEELFKYQEHNLFDLLRYLIYLVDTMKSNNIIWGVGRGSSVSSFVLFKLEVHKINSMFYELNIDEFLRNN